MKTGTYSNPSKVADMAEGNLEEDGATATIDLEIDAHHINNIAYVKLYFYKYLINKLHIIIEFL